MLIFDECTCKMSMNFLTLYLSLITGCICPSAGVGYQFNTTKELIKRMEEMKKKLKIEREKTNAFIRSKTSVKDSRTSSTGIGFVLGWGIIGSLPVTICLGDAASLLRHMRHGV